jgi:uncharacterized protein (TIGR02687 family)
VSLERIHDGLGRKFSEHRIVFWYDTTGEFRQTVSEIRLDGLRTIRLDQTGSFEAKLAIETGDPTSRILVYAPFDCPSPNDDVLLDVFLYSGHFSADTAEIIRDELGLQVPEIREYIKERLPFFSEGRKRELKGYIEGPEDDEALGRKMIRVLLGARGNSSSELVLALFKTKADCGESELKELADLAKFKLHDLLWELVARDFEYSHESPTLGGLLNSFIATDIAQHLGEGTPAPLKRFAAAQAHKASNISVLMSMWRDSDRLKASYGTLIAEAAEDLRLKTLLSAVKTNLLLRVQTVEAVELLLLERCRDILSASMTQSDREEAETIILNRRNSYWSVARESFRAAYNSMFAALNLLKLKEEYPNGFIAADIKGFAALYTNDLYRFDEEYRNYYKALAGDGVSGRLKQVTERVEELYNEWFLPTLASAWSPFVDNFLLKEWTIPGMINQHRFYAQVVTPLLRSNPAPRVAVIVSDALRYEAGRNLTALLNKRDNFKAEISPLLGVLPSHTALGMATLLPHETVNYDEAGAVVVDGINSQGLANRNQILQRKGGLAISATDIKSQTKEELRSRIGDSSLLYIYHDRIDETGDNQKSEREVFDAVAQTLEELESITTKTLNSLNCSVVVITADHGFIFTNGELLETERSEIEIHSGNPIIEKKRYIVGASLDAAGAAWKTTTKNTAHTERELDVIVPRGINRFHFKGGARYFHGGAMPQELFTPSIIVRKARDKAVEKTRTSKVDVALLSSTSRITAPRQSFKFIQTDLVTEKRLPRKVSVGFYDDTGSELVPISDVHRLNFDATEDNQTHREQTVTFVFKSVRFDPAKEYVLAILDQENDYELSRHPFQVKILIADEFN